MLLRGKPNSNRVPVTREYTRRCLFADIALLGVALNLAALLLLPLLRPDLNILRSALSAYTVGPWSGLQTLAFLAMTATSLSLAIGLSMAALPSGWATVSLMLLLVSGVACAGMVLFPIGSSGPTTTIGDAHQTAGTIAGVTQVAAALTFGLGASVAPTWTGQVRPALVAFAVAVAAAILSQLALWRPDLGIPIGITLRLIVLPLVLLWGSVALRLREGC